MNGGRALNHLLRKDMNMMSCQSDILYECPTELNSAVRDLDNSFGRSSAYANR